MAGGRTAVRRNLPYSCIRSKSISLRFVPPHVARSCRRVGGSSGCGGPRRWRRRCKPAASPAVRAHGPRGEVYGTEVWGAGGRRFVGCDLLSVVPMFCTSLQLIGHVAQRLLSDNAASIVSDVLDGHDLEYYAL